MWSRRVDADLTANRLTTTVRALQAANRPILDLTLSNPTRAGLHYPADLLDGLAAAPGLIYQPDPFGLIEARRAVAADYLRRGVRVDPDRIVLTASTSEAYSLLLKVLCDPHDDVLVPRPSYPLLDHLARLEAVSVRSYDLEYHGRWALDFLSLQRAWSDATRAVIVVSPNNPTGSSLTPSELDRLCGWCGSRSTAIIVDEVFADYPLSAATTPAAGALQRDDVLSFSLGGLSKSVALPQLKLAWLVAAGPPDLVQQALSRLEFAADAYLSVATPVQVAASLLLERGGIVRDQIRQRVVANYRFLNEAITSDCGCTILHADAGWYAVVRVPAIAPEEDLVLDLLENEGVLTHPGYFFDFGHEAYLVVSLLPSEDVFHDGVRRIVRHFACRMDRR